MKLAFRLTQTARARKTTKISAPLRSLMKEAARLVAMTEIPELSAYDLSVVTMSDDELLDINRSALGHDYYTDILTFEIERTATRLEAELYFSVERAKENAKRYKASIEEELIHLVIHGTLHLAGYDDGNKLDKKRMKIRERFFLAQFQHRMDEIGASGSLK
jgi:probable rRNA maturation factor